MTLHHRVAARANSVGLPISEQAVQMIARFIAEDRDLCPSQYQACGKQVLQGNTHVADAADPATADLICAALQFRVGAFPTADTPGGCEGRPAQSRVNAVSETRGVITAKDGNGGLHAAGGNL